MAYAYGWGAAIVIIGALFKILHIKGADLWLIIGMSTEAVIFFLSAFEPIHEELDWTLVYPELAGMEGDSNSVNSSTESVSQQLDKMLAEAKVGPELIEGLGTGLRSLSENIGNMADLSGATVATKEYADNISKASTALSSMSNSYNRAVEALDSLADTTEAFRSSSSAIANVNNNLAELDRNLENLNTIYGGMLNAMRPK
ncbi:MAG: gliding motility protein GldL [Bacteroidetes bacterium]|nr:gliding motility protein GldL [Bacteroidota bacterium]